VASPSCVDLRSYDPAAVAATLDKPILILRGGRDTDEEGSGEITMRALADRLGVRSPMALSRYVGSKGGLTDLMVDRVYDLFAVPQGEGWRPALDGLGRSACTAVQAHPWFARLAFGRPPLGPNALQVYDAALAELDALGLDAATRMGSSTPCSVMSLARGSRWSRSRPCAHVPAFARMRTSVPPPRPTSSASPPRAPIPTSAAGP
jgi:hypothetical protein